MQLKEMEYAYIKTHQFHSLVSLIYQQVIPESSHILNEADISQRGEELYFDGRSRVFGARTSFTISESATRRRIKSHE